VEQLRAELDEEHRAVLTIQKNAADEMRAEFASERDTMRQEIDHLRQSAIRALDESRSPAAEHEAAAPSAHGQPEHVRIFAEALKKMSSIFERDVSAVVQRGVLELMAETDRLRSDLEQVADYASQLEGDRNRVTDECQRVKRQLDEAKASGPGSKAPTPDAIQTEIARVEGLLNALSDIIVDPGADLTEGIRRNAERTELESYLRGIRFSLHG
jgi:tRNA(Glu) U13 pseudouridine synthase TruD